MISASVHYLQVLAVSSYPTFNKCDKQLLYFQQATQPTAGSDLVFKHRNHVVIRNSQQSCGVKRRYSIKSTHPKNTSN